MNTLDTLPVTLDDVLEAQKLLEGIIMRTPVESSRALGAMVGGDVAGRFRVWARFPVRPEGAGAT